MARPNSGLAYPERFYAAAAYAGFGGSPSSSDATAALSRFQNDVALLLYGLYQQATVGPCNVPKPRAWNPVEHSKWTSWHGLGNMASTEAMRLFVKILEEEDPAWYSRVPESIVHPIIDVEMHKPQSESATPTGNSFPMPKTISPDNRNVVETQDKNVIMEGIGAIDVYDQWVAPSVSGNRPKPRYQHGAALVQDKMYIFGGNHNGRYLSDLQVLDLKSLTWSKLEAKSAVGSPESSTSSPVAPCAGHSLIPWGSKILSIAGRTKNPSDSVTVKEFDPQTCTWSNLKTYGKPPISRGGQSVTLVGTTVVMFGGEDAKRNLLNDLHILDLETLTWDEIDAIGTPPSPRSDHVAACHADQYLLVFGGGSHAACFNDLNVLDLKNMEWSRPMQRGVTPAPRAGHAGTTVGENWFIVGGGDNKSGVSETLVLNMSTLSWSVVTTAEGYVPVASEGLSLVLSTYGGEDFLVSFGGYNGCYSNEVYVLKASCKSVARLKLINPMSDSIAALLPTTNAGRDVEPEHESSLDGKLREAVIEDEDPEIMNIFSEDTGAHIVSAFQAENREIDADALLTKDQLQNLQLKQELSEAESRNIELTKELQSVRGQMATEQSRCFKLEVDVAELRQKLQMMETLQKEVELLQRQKAASEQAALSAKQTPRGMWGWLAGTPPQKSDF